MNLANGLVPSGLPLLTNHPDGWVPLVKLFQEFHNKWADNRKRFPITLEANYFKREDKLIQDLAWRGRISDLSDGTYRLEDMFAAFEWNRTLRPHLIGDHRYGDYIAIDFRGVSPESWARDDRFMVCRGIRSIRLLSPVWYLQTKGQNVEEWTGLGNNPIFTQHTPDQWNWMWELMLEPSWLATYEKDAHVRFSKILSQACGATKQRDNSYYQGKIWSGK